MAEPRHGVLRWGKPKGYGGGRWGGRQLTVIEGQTHHKIEKPERVLTSELRRLSVEELAGREVEFDWDGRDVRAIRPRGATDADGGDAEVPDGFELTETGRLRPASRPCRPNRARARAREGAPDGG